MNLFLVVVGAVLAAAGGYGVVRGRRRDVERSLIAGTETTDALRVTPGPVELVGRAVPTEDGPLRAPFTDDDVIAARWDVDEWEESGEHASWRDVDGGVVAAPFYLDDGTDRVLVRPDGARFDLDPAGEETWEVGVDEAPPESIASFLALDSTPGEPRGAFVKALDWGQQVGDRRYAQNTVEPGDEVYVYGTATRVGAREFGDNDYEVVAGADDGHPDAGLFLIADRTEADLLAARRHARRYILAGAAGVLAGVVLLGIGLLG